MPRGFTYSNPWMVDEVSTLPGTRILTPEELEGTVIPVRNFELSQEDRARRDREMEEMQRRWDAEIRRVSHNYQSMEVPESVEPVREGFEYSKGTVAHPISVLFAKEKEICKK